MTPSRRFSFFVSAHHLHHHPSTVGYHYTLLVPGNITAMNQLRTTVPVSLGASRSVIIDYQYSRAALNLLQQVDLNDIDTIKEHYKDLPRTIKNIPKHLLGISTEFSTVGKTTKWFSGLNATEQRI